MDGNPCFWGIPQLQRMILKAIKCGKRAVEVFLAVFEKLVSTLRHNNSGAADWLKLLVVLQRYRQPLTRAVRLLSSWVETVPYAYL